MADDEYTRNLKRDIKTLLTDDQLRQQALLIVELEAIAKRFEWDKATYSGAAIAAIIRERINGIR